ncbi:hypothetical protein SAMN03097708_01437 [Thiohalomonas denitrificans]|uniref:Uncharacterized protein n=2 Tax=Thiohalomonas denitrificans TaxID=415747 RepID=A0A1G5Q6J6_9GAMM|nr:hypothetical protein SAMN03097708_01437 [Thiohalomonas denitrificans]
MPELYWYYGYPVVLLIMLFVAGGMLLYFWRRIGSPGNSGGHKGQVLHSAAIDVQGQGINEVTH